MTKGFSNFHPNDLIRDWGLVSYLRDRLACRSRMGLRDDSEDGLNICVNAVACDPASRIFLALLFADLRSALELMYR